jgi:hypothetical protein
VTQVRLSSLTERLLHYVDRDLRVVQQGQVAQADVWNHIDRIQAGNPDLRLSST